MNFFARKQLALACIALMMVFFIRVCISASLTEVKQSSTHSIQQQLAALEALSGGRLGIAAINTADNTRIQYRADERFPLQSTFKMMIVAAILKASMQDPHLLQQKIMYTKQDLVTWSPITEKEKHLTDGMTIAELSAATLMYSDNTAANLLMQKLGQPKAVTDFARSIGDNAFRLDHDEPLLASRSGDVHDTTTPAAMAKSLHKLALGNALASSQQQQLVAWLKGNTTGDARIRAGVPKRWIVADKTGSGDYGITNDIGIIWPPQCAPIVVAIYFMQNKKEAKRRDDVIASATRLLLNAFAQADPCIKRNV